MDKTLIAALTMTLLIIVFPAGGSRSAHAQSSHPLDVHIRNFPETMRIKGSVSIDGTTSHSKYLKREGILVPPSRRNELSELTFAGMVETDGFTSISLNVQGEVKSGSFSSGAVGVLLIPDEEPVMRSLREAKRVSFPLEAVASLKSGDLTYFDSEQTRQEIGFPRYRMFLYNTVNKSVEANVYLYLSN